jgi:hypothetical protein
MATKVNLIMDQAATFSSSFTVLDILGNSIDFSTYTASSQMRKTYMSVNSYSFSVVANSTGGITLSMPANTTANICPGRYVYDVEVIDNAGVKSRIAEGIITVTPQVTR